MSSSRSDDDSDEEEDETIATEARPEDKENALPNDGSDESSERSKARTGRKRKRKIAEKARRQAQESGATRRQRIRQYYNGATHGSASAVQLFAMARHVSSAHDRHVLCIRRLIYNMCSFPKLFFFMEKCRRSK